MLLTFDRLRAKPTLFKAFTGVSLSEFELLVTQSTPLWVEREQQRLLRPKRQRAPGGGCKPTFGLRGQLLVTLVWLRLYLTTETLGFLFGIDKATVSRYTRAILPVLRQVGDATLGWVEPPKRGQGKNLAAARATYPDLFAIVDATEQPVQRLTMRQCPVLGSVAYCYRCTAAPWRPRWQTGRGRWPVRRPNSNLAAFGRLYPAQRGVTDLA